jgi:hypothetical protein
VNGEIKAFRDGSAFLLKNLPQKITPDKDARYKDSIRLLNATFIFKNSQQASFSDGEAVQISLICGRLSAA